MTEEDILNCLGNGTRKVYKYTGSKNELEIKLQEAGISHNRIIANDIIYFICPLNDDISINDDKLSILNPN